MSTSLTTTWTCCPMCRLPFMSPALPSWTRSRVRCAFNHSPMHFSPKNRPSMTRFGLFRLVRAVAIAILATPSVSVYAQEALQANLAFDPATKVFRMDAAGISYVFGINDQNELQTLYWGNRLSEKDHFGAAKELAGAGSFDPPSNVTSREFVGWGGMMYAEPDLKITFPDGNRDLVLHYVSHQIDGDTLLVRMKDISREVYVTLRYRMDGETGVLERSAVIENKTTAPFTIEQVAAGTWNLPRGTDYRLRYLSGRWAGEWTVNEQPIGPGKTILESRRGSTGDQNNPWFAIDRTGSNDQDHGDVWFGALGWSGSWQISVEQDEAQQIRVTGGPNTFDFGYRLAPGAHLQS